ncbi:MAG: hypothetical protein HGA22_08695, partial [Clostridiales bacterium]|nr:hypothetical protein [Clostridiales bacterium]
MKGLCRLIGKMIFCAAIILALVVTSAYTADAATGGNGIIALAAGREHILALREIG